MPDKQGQVDMAVLVVAKDKIVLEGDRLSSEEYNIEVVGRC